MAQQLWSDPNYGHGFLVPVFAAYILWRARSRMREVTIQSSNWGLPIMLSAIGLLILGTLGSEHFTARISLLFLLGGIVVFLFGWHVFRSVAFPIGYLVFMIPMPAIIYYQLTFPLQVLASRLGASGLVALGVPTVREGNLLILPNVTLEVVEACSRGPIAALIVGRCCRLRLSRRANHLETLPIGRRNSSDCDLEQRTPLGCNRRTEFFPRAKSGFGCGSYRTWLSIFRNRFPFDSLGS